jgi:hypothetical protein
LGGSNLAFGPDSRFIECRLRRSVVNMGLHADVGLKFMLNEVKPYIKHGDIIILSPEYEQFFDDYCNGKSYLWNILCVFPEGIRFVDSPGQLIRMARSLPESLSFKAVRLRKRVVAGIEDRISGPSGDCGNSNNNPNDVVETIYCRGAFNKQGDVVTHIGRPSPSSLEAQLKSCQAAVLDKRTPNDMPDEAALTLVRDFARFTAGKNARMILIWPSVPPAYFEMKKKNIEAVARELSKYPEIEIRGAPGDEVLPTTCFFDAFYHLNAEGRSRKTRQICNLLSEWDTHEKDCDFLFQANPDLSGVGSPDHLK